MRFKTHELDRLTLLSHNWQKIAKRINSQAVFYGCCYNLCKIIPQEVNELYQSDDQTVKRIHQIRAKVTGKIFDFMKSLLGTNDGSVLEPLMCFHCLRPFLFHCSQKVDLCSMQRLEIFFGHTTEQNRHATHSNIITGHFFFFVFMMLYTESFDY